VNSNDRSLLEHPDIVTLLISILVKRLGGVVEITQQDIDEMQGLVLEERVNPYGAKFNLTAKGDQAPSKPLH
jgi:hypothetical protein